MSECWQDGALRAFADRELPDGELARLSTHLEQCTHCRMRYLILSARAERVRNLVGGLAEPAAVPSMARLPEPARRPNYWMAAAVALAAAWAAFVLLVPKRVQAPPAAHRAVMPMAASAQTAPPVPMVSTAPPVAMQMAIRPGIPVRVPAMRPVRRTTPPRATLAGFVPLDDDPIDAGVILRVALAEGRMQADVVYSPDGRPRAIRLVSNPAGK